MSVSTVTSTILKAAGLASGEALLRHGKELGKFTAAYADDLSSAALSPKALAEFMESGKDGFKAAGYSDDFLRNFSSVADDIVKTNKSIKTILADFKGMEAKNINAFIATQGKNWDEALRDVLSEPDIQAKIFGKLDDAAPNLGGNFDDVAKKKPMFESKDELQAELNRLAKEAYQGDRAKIYGSRLITEKGVSVPFAKGKIDPSRGPANLEREVAARIPQEWEMGEIALETKIGDAIKKAEKGSLLSRKSTYVLPAIGAAGLAGDHYVYTPGNNLLESWGMADDKRVSYVDAVVDTVKNPFSKSTTEKTVLNGEGGTKEAPTKGSLGRTFGKESGLFDSAVKMMSKLTGNDALSKIMITGTMAIMGVGLSNFLPGWSGLGMKAIVLGSIAAIASGSKIDAGISSTVKDLVGSAKDGLSRAMAEPSPGT